MTTYIKLIIRYRILVLAAILLITAGFAAIASQGVIASSIGNLFFGDDHPEYRDYTQRIREFANDEVVIIAYDDPDFLTPTKLEKLQQIHKKIEAISDVGRVDSLINAQHTYAIDDTLYVEKYSDEIRRRPEEKEDILAALKIDRLIRGLLVSESGQQSTVMIELEPDDTRPVERGPLVVREVFDIFEEGGHQRKDLHQVGLIATLSEIMVQSQYNLTRLFPVVCISLLIVLYIMFHRFWPVFITLVVSLLAVIWTVGFAVLLDRNINIFVTFAPAVILIVTTSDVIHLCSAYMLELSQGKAKAEAIFTSGREVGTACLMTSITTFLGFVSMSMVPVPAFRQIGLVLGFGVAVALLLAMTLAPILFWVMKKPVPWNDDVSRIQKLLTHSLSGIRRLPMKRPRVVCLVFGLVFALSVVGVMFLNIETDFNKRLAADNVIRIDEAYFNQHFVGANFLDVFIETPEADGVLDPNRYAKIARFQKELEKIPNINKVVSLVDLIDIIDGELHPGNKDKQPQPITRQLLAQYLLLFEMSGGQDLDRFVDSDRRTLRMAVRLSDNRVRATYDVGHKIKALGSQILDDTSQVQATGLTFLMGMFLDDIFNGQRMGIIFAFLSILLLMIIWMKSVRIGLWSMIPNLLPILALGGYLGFFWEDVDSDTIAIAMIAIGIGVDDTIHFLMRLRYESARTADIGEALKRTFHFTGRAIMITTIILVFGFAPFAMSDYFTIRIMGTLLPFALIVALLADLLLVPALVQLGAIRFYAQSGSN